MPDETSASAPDAAPTAAAPDPARPAGRRVKAAVLVDLDLCKACGICVNLCPEHVFDRDAAGLAVAARQEDCSACRLCEWHCPDFAIEVLVEMSSRPASAAAAGSTDGPGTDAEDA
jgi:2-oxoglutarate ferredoxin oxidoreductase subunit delta